MDQRVSCIFQPLGVVRRKDGSREAMAEDQGRSLLG